MLSQGIASHYRAPGPVGPRQTGIGPAIVGIELDCCLEKGDGFRKVFRRPSAIMIRTLEKGVVGCRDRRLYVVCLGRLAARQVDCQSSDDLPHHCVLQGENVGQRAIVFLRPEMKARERVDELGIYPHFIAGAAHAAFQDITHTQLFRHLPHLHRRTFIGKGGIPRDHE